jgi:hypothetical protein
MVRDAFCERIDGIRRFERAFDDPAYRGKSCEERTTDAENEYTWCG